MSLTSADDLDKSDIRKAASEYELDGLGIDEGPFSNLDGSNRFADLDKMDLEQTIEKKADDELDRRRKASGVQDFDPSLEAEMARIDEEVQRERVAIEEEQAAMRDSFAKIDVAQKEEFAANDSEDELAQDENPFSAFAPSNKLDKNEFNPPAEDTPFSAKESEFTLVDSEEEVDSKFDFQNDEFGSDQDNTSAEFSNDWVDNELSEQNEGMEFESFGEKAWVGEAELEESHALNNKEADSSFSSSASVDSSNDWIESQPIRPNPAYQQESGRMIFDSKSVPSRFMTPEEKENWFRQTKLERLEKKSISLPGEGMDESGREQVIQTVAGFETSTQNKATELPLLNLNSAPIQKSVELQKSVEPKFEPVPQESSVKLGVPQWEEQQVSSTEIPQFDLEEIKPAARNEELQFATIVPPVVSAPGSSDELEKDSFSDFGAGFQAQDAATEEGSLPEIDWGDVPETELVVTDIPDLTTESARSTSLPGRWVGIIFSLGTICYLIIRRRTPAKTASEATRKG
ncbi:MAG: hypothetical protein R3C11_08070 [Planctomycetaceae bacterium]